MLARKLSNAQILDVSRLGELTTSHALPYVARRFHDATLMLFPLGWRADTQI